MVIDKFMKIIKRKEIKKISEIYKTMLKTEKHHQHEIIEDEHGTYRWKANSIVRELIDDKIDLNDLVLLFHHLGYDKNSEVYRQLYRDMGYSLSGYYDIFYWEANNEAVDEYVPNPMCVGKK